MKKILSVILVLSMVLALGVTAFAAEYGQSTGVLEAGESYGYAFNVDTSNGVKISDINGILSFSDPIVVNGTVVVNVRVPAGAVGKITKIVVTSDDANKTVLAEEYVTVAKPENAGIGGTGQYTGDLEVGKSYGFSFNVDTSNGITISDTNGILAFGTPIVGSDIVVVSVTVPTAAAGQITKIVVKAKDTAKTVLQEMYVTVAAAEIPDNDNATVTPTPTPTNPSTPSTSQKPNTSTGANNATAAVVALAVMAVAATVSKKIVK